MALSKGYIHNFETLKRCVKHGDLALIEGSVKATGRKVAIIAAIQLGSDGLMQVVPFGHLCPDDPYEYYNDPTAEGHGHG